MPRTQGRSTASVWLKGSRLWQLALAFLAGNLLLQQMPVVPVPGFRLVAALAALFVIARFGFGLVCLPAIAMLAWCWTAQCADQGLVSRWPDRLDGRDVQLSGWVDSRPRRDAGRYVFTLRVNRAETDIPLRRLRLSWYEPAPELKAGQTLTIEARLRAPRGLVNPGGFDYERWLFLEGFDATGYVRSGNIVAQDSTGLAGRWLKLRTRLAQRIAELVPDADAAALLTAVSLGERSGFSDRHWQVFQRTGTSHLVAVSGLHVGLIAAIAFLVMLRIALRLPVALARHAHTIAALGSTVPAVLYAALAGFALPTQRALIMLLVAELVVVSRRRVPASSGLSLALLAVLVVDPLASLTASFWLSFSAVGLLLAVAVDHRSRVAAYVHLQWALTLGLAPLVIWFFGQVSLASFLVNLIAIPVFSLIVVPLSLILVFAAAVNVGTTLIASGAGTAAGWAWRGLDAVAAQPFAVIELPQPAIAAVLLALAGVAMAVVRHRLPGRHLALIGLMPLVVSHGADPESGELRVTVFDVGQGLSVLIETTHHRILYDAGPLYRSGFDAGAEIVGPAVAALGSASLDLMIISHADSDHSGGAESIIARYPAVRVLAGPDVGSLADDECREGQVWSFDQVRFEMLHPVASFVPEGNETSCVLKIEAEAGSLLLTGDIERLAETRLLREANPAADVIVVPHHGSLTSSSVPFVDAVDAKLALVSAGFNNRWGFPRPEVVERWQASGARLLVTADEGAISVLFGKRGISLKVARDRRLRYWQSKRDVVSGAQGP